MLSNCSKLHPPSVMASLPLFYIPPFFQPSFHSFPFLHSPFSSLSHSPLDVSLTMRQAVLAFPPHPSHPPNSLSLSLSFSSFSITSPPRPLSASVWISWSHTEILERPHMYIHVEEGERRRKREGALCIGLTPALLIVLQMLSIYCIITSMHAAHLACCIHRGIIYRVAPFHNTGEYFSTVHFSHLFGPPIHVPTHQLASL